MAEESLVDTIRRLDRTIEGLSSTLNNLGSMIEYQTRSLKADMTALDAKLDLIRVQTDSHFGILRSEMNSKLDAVVTALRGSGAPRYGGVGGTAESPGSARRSSAGHTGGEAEEGEVAAAAAVGESAARSS